MDNEALANAISAHLSEYVLAVDWVEKDIVTVELLPEHLIAVAEMLKADKQFDFDLLLDICGVDYADYGMSYWRDQDITGSGFSRGVSEKGYPQENVWKKPRYGVIYHLLSIAHNHRVRLKVYLSPEPQVASVMDIWPAANWYEREAFDLFGIVFVGHPDLRRLLTDYGFKGHPFRKDFPLIGEVEMRYDAKAQRCVYEPVSIVPRVLVPKVIRRDNRYQNPVAKSESDV